MPTIAPSSFLPGIVKFTSEGDGSAATSTFSNSEDYFAIPLSAVPTLTFADTDPTTGDIRQIVYALEIALLEAYAALSTVNKPTKWVPRVGTSATTSGAVKRYSNEFSVTYTGEVLASE